MKLILFAVALVLSASVVSAQTVTIDPTTLQFTASPDHTATNIDGTFVVASYQFDAVAPNSIGAIAITLGLGKPTPDASNIVTLNLATTFATLTPNATYYATVTAVGPSGSGVSAQSNPFARAGAPKVPSAPTNVRVIKAS